jgi:hypothetical protein
VNLQAQQEMLQDEIKKQSKSFDKVSAHILEVFNPFVDF